MTKPRRGTSSWSTWAKGANPPLDDVPANREADLAALALLDDADLRRAARAMMSAKEQSELHQLLDRQGGGDLADAESTRLDELMQRYGELTVRKAHAYLLLGRRGYRAPTQESGR